MWNSSKIFLCHCQDESDRYKYQGSEIHVLLMDELTTFSEPIYTFLRSRVRCVNLDIPEHYKCKIPRIVCSSNPGGCGHSWVKRTFIDDHEPLEIWRASPEEGGMLRQYIPAKLEDNPSLTEQDPTYDARLSGLGTPELVRAYRDGDWNIIQGAFLPEFTDLNIIKPFPIPADWPKVRAMDWGSRDPACIVWMTITPEDISLDEPAPRVLKHGYYNTLYSTDRRIVPKHSRIIYREWYIGDDRGRGLRLSNDELAGGICERELPDENVFYGVAGRDVFRNLGGPTIAQQLNQIAATRYHRKNLFSRQADNRRIPGWSEFRSRLVGVEGYPQLYLFDTCHAGKKYIPMLQADEKKHEDATQNMDHYPEAVRYALMAFLFPEPKPGETDTEWRQEWTLDALWKEHDERNPYRT